MADNGRPTEQARVRRWQQRLKQANKIYDTWSDRYETGKLEDYYLGRQWKGIEEDKAKKLYVINMVYASVEVNKPSLVFDRPTVRMQARADREATPSSNVDGRAQLCQDAVQTYIDDPDFEFQEETALALQEAHFRFGVIEVGYSADWIDNPDVGKPVLMEEDRDSPQGLNTDADQGLNIPQPAEDETEDDGEGNKIPKAPKGRRYLRDQENRVVRQGPKLVRDEMMYIKRIPAYTFRCSLSSKNKLTRNDWVGYYEWHYVEDIKRNKTYRNTNNLKATGVISKGVRGDDDQNHSSFELDQYHGMVKIWKIWDLRQRIHHVIAEGHSRFLIEGEKYTFLPFALLRFHDILDSFYPLPPVYNWIGPQDEVNETREMQRAHRRRFYRRYQYKTGMVEEPELEKLETDGDGVYCEVGEINAITPIADAPLSADVWQHLDRSQMDFMTVSSVGGEQRGVADSDTATQASIIDQRSRLRESAARDKVAKWLSRVARLMLFTLREKMTLPFLIKRVVDPNGDPAVIQNAMDTWKEITGEDLEDIDLDVTVDLASLSPISEDILRNSWNQVLMLLANPALVMLLSQSDILLRKTLRLYGISAAAEIAEVSRVLKATAAQIQMQAAMLGAGGGGGRPAQPAGGMAGRGGQPLTGPTLAATIGAATQGGVA